MERTGNEWDSVHFLAHTVPVKKMQVKATWRPLGGHFVLLSYFHPTAPSTRLEMGRVYAKLRLLFRYIASAVPLKVNNIPAYHLHGFSIILLSYLC